MNKAKPIAGLVILALLGSGAWYLLHDRTTETREPTAWGHVDTRSVSLAFEIGGRIAELGPEEGMRVKAGDVLGRLDTRSLELERARLIASAEALKAQYSLAEEGARQEDIAVARAELAALRQSLRLARITADRQEELYRAKATTEQLRDEARFTLAQRTAQEKSLAEQLRKLENGSRPQESPRPGRSGRPRRPRSRSSTTKSTCRACFARPPTASCACAPRNPETWRSPRARSSNSRSTTRSGCAPISPKRAWAKCAKATS